MKINKTVRTREEAQEIVAQLLLNFGTQSASQRLKSEARDAHQTITETARRTAGNLLKSFVARKPNGYVVG